MEITAITINHMTAPRGYKLDDLTIAATVAGTDYPQDLTKRLVITTNDEMVFQSDWESAGDLSFQPQFKMKPRTEYHVSYQLRADAIGTLEAESNFETGLMEETTPAKWIGSDDATVHGLQLTKTFELANAASHARLYIGGLGLYEAYIDGIKVGDEYLTPGFTNYRYYTQINTYAVTAALKQPGEHRLTIVLGDGWYRGKLGIKAHGGLPNQYGDALMANASLIYLDQIGEHEVLTDSTWQATRSQIPHSGIYYGEDLDETLPATPVALQTFPQPSKYVYDRLSLPVKVHEQLPVKQVIHTNDGAVILDFGQNMAGWVSFNNRLPKGTKVSLEYGELLQDGDLYRKNLRSARASFTYISNGTAHVVRPHFTYFGFRYVRLRDFPESVDPADFTALALYSDMPATGDIQTGNKAVDRLFQNVQWGQRSNFVDIPTDCPQRDERLGWTGDAAIFARTASLNRDTYQFNRKYMFDVAVEQSLHDGMVPLYVPAVDEHDGGKAVWSDVATIIPWVSYTRSGDASILQQNFGAMMSWVDWVHDRAKAQGQEYLWLDDEQLGDWLALDTEDIMHLKGRTPDELIASAYYYQSAMIVAQTAGVLKARHEHDYYHMLADKIREAFIAEFFTASGRLITDTQTALALCLQLNLVPAGSTKRLTQALVARLEKDRNHLTTGFVGTPALLPALSANGQHELAVQLFLNTDFPSWLYEVEHGATTIWERWDSLDDQGRIADNGMNSLNHYSTGAVMQWAYEALAGIQQVAPMQVQLKPGITASFKTLKAHTAMPTGDLKLAWQLDATGQQVHVEIEIPYGVEATLTLPGSQEWCDRALSAGHHEFTYQPDTPFVKHFDVHTPLYQFNQDQALAQQLQPLVPFWDFLMLPGNMAHFEQYSLMQLSREMRGIGFAPLSQTQINAINTLFIQHAKQAQED